MVQSKLVVFACIYLVFVGISAIFKGRGVFEANTLIEAALFAWSYSVLTWGLEHERQKYMDEHMDEQ